MATLSSPLLILDRRTIFEPAAATATAVSRDSKKIIIRLIFHINATAGNKRNRKNEKTQKQKKV